MGFGYDANGRMVKATKTSVPDALSVYDAAGLRVAERVNDIWRFLIYDIGGKMVAEYGGLQSTDEGGVKYLLSDWQGSTRAVLSNSGTVNGRADYTAYGEEIGAGIGLRTTGQGYGAANAPRQKYGLTERDDGTGMDHTWFRKHENRAGKWTGADPYNGSMSLGNPQSFNRYSYVENQPTNFVDPSGLFWAIDWGSCYAEVAWDGERLHFTGRLFCNAVWTKAVGPSGGGGGGGRGGGGTPTSSQISNNNDYNKCVKEEKAKCYNIGRKHFDDNFWSRIGSDILGWADIVALSSALTYSAAKIFSLNRLLSILRTVTVFAAKKGFAFYGIVASAAWSVRTLAHEGAAKEEECEKDIENKCSKYKKP